MKNTSVYCALIEIKPLDGCELDRTKIAGASVRCYIPAATSEGAIKHLTNTLHEMKMELVEIEWCVDFDQTEWSNSNNYSEENHVAQARQSGTVVFDMFHAWGHNYAATFMTVDLVNVGA